MASTLVINPGSSSRKYALYVAGRPAFTLAFESTENGFMLCSDFAGMRQVCESVTADEFAEAGARVYHEVDEYLRRSGAGVLDAVVVRVVAPGTFFQEHRVIDDVFVAALQQCETSAALHIPVVLQEIKQVRAHFTRQPVIAASDSAFHVTMPLVARTYSFRAEDVRQYDLHRFGYHGLSVASVVRRIHPLVGIEPKKLIVCHIGSGVSVTAVKDGKSVDTTMGFSPSSGLLMGSRGGDIDTSALLELMRRKHWRASDAALYLGSQCGLLGLAGEADIRRLLDRRAGQDLIATAALDTFIYQLQKAIAAQVVALGGLDVLALTATAAVRSSTLRGLLLQGLGPIGVDLSSDRNDALVGKDGVISARGSAVKAVVLRTDEMGEMVYVAEHVLRASEGKNSRLV